MPFLHHAERPVYLSHDARHGRFARAGVSGEHHVVGDGGHLEAGSLALLRHAHELHEARHLLLHGLEADETVQLRERLLHGHLVRGGGRVAHAGRRDLVALLRLCRIRRIVQTVRPSGLVAHRTENGKQHGADEDYRPDQPPAPAVKHAHRVESPPGTPHENGEDGRVGQRAGQRLRPHRAREADDQHDVQKATDRHVANKTQPLLLRAHCLDLVRTCDDL